MPHTTEWKKSLHAVNMMSDLQPLVLYAFAPFAASANPWKVAFILEELDLPYRFEKIQAADTKQQPFLAMNPNGKVPVLRDPNNESITIWEASQIQFEGLPKIVHIQIG